MNGNFPSTTIGWTAIATGTAVVLAVVFITLMYTVNMIFGPINDVFNSIVGIFSAVLAWMLCAEHHAKSPLMSQVALTLTVIGAIFAIVGSILVIFKFTGFVLAGWYTTVCNALIGLWLAIFCYSMLPSEALPHNLVTFGVVAGLFMAIGLASILGITGRIDSFESMPWYLNIGYLGYLGIYILYPIWVIWLGRVLLQK